MKLQLGEVLRKWRLMSELSLRDAAVKMGLDHSTLNRLEQGQMPSCETLIAVWTFLTSGKNGNE